MSDVDDDDPMGPPKDACECWCLHCRRVFMSNEMWFQRVIGDPTGFKGYWMCPTANCDGKGFTFDIFPTDPEHPANDGWVDDDGDEDADYDPEMDLLDAEDESESEYDPDESRWKQLDEELGEYDEDDLEGEEWKHGLEPGERPAEPAWAEQARLEREEEERKYDQPDERPREIEYRDSTDRAPRGQTPFPDDDIPF
jgi:hypothetical protein